MRVTPKNLAESLPSQEVADDLEAKGNRARSKWERDRKPLTAHGIVQLLNPFCGRPGGTSKRMPMQR